MKILCAGFGLFLFATMAMAQSLSDLSAKPNVLKSDGGL